MSQYKKLLLGTTAAFLAFSGLTTAAVASDDTEELKGSSASASTSTSTSTSTSSSLSSSQVGINITSISFTPEEIDAAFSNVQTSAQLSDSSVADGAENPAASGVSNVINKDQQGSIDQLFDDFGQGVSKIPSVIPQLPAQAPLTDGEEDNIIAALETDARKKNLIINQGHSEKITKILRGLLLPTDPDQRDNTLKSLGSIDHWLANGSNDQKALISRLHGRRFIDQALSLRDLPEMLMSDLRDLFSDKMADKAEKKINGLVSDPFGRCSNTKDVFKLLLKNKKHTDADFNKTIEAILTSQSPSEELSSYLGLQEITQRGKFFTELLEHAQKTCGDLEKKLQEGLSPLLKDDERDVLGELIYSGLVDFFRDNYQTFYNAKRTSSFDNLPKVQQCALSENVDKVLEYILNGQMLGGKQIAAAQALRCIGSLSSGMGTFKRKLLDLLMPKISENVNVHTRQLSPISFDTGNKRKNIIQVINMLANDEVQAADLLSEYFGRKKEIAKQKIERLTSEKDALEKRVNDLNRETLRLQQNNKDLNEAKGQLECLRSVLIDASISKSDQDVDKFFNLINVLNEQQCFKRGQFVPTKQVTNDTYQGFLGNVFRLFTGCARDEFNQVMSRLSHPSAVQYTASAGNKVAQQDPSQQSQQQGTTTTTTTTTTTSSKASNPSGGVSGNGANNSSRMQGFGSNNPQASDNSQQQAPSPQKPASADQSGTGQSSPKQSDQQSASPKASNLSGGVSGNGAKNSSGISNLGFGNFFGASDNSQQQAPSPQKPSTADRSGTGQSSPKQSDQQSANKQLTNDAQFGQGNAPLPSQGFSPTNTGSRQITTLSDIEGFKNSNGVVGMFDGQPVYCADKASRAGCLEVYQDDSGQWLVAGVRLTSVKGDVSRRYYEKQSQPVQISQDQNGKLIFTKK